jgi:hypothetical protein
MVPNTLLSNMSCSECLIGLPVYHCEWYLRLCSVTLLFVIFNIVKTDVALVVILRSETLWLWSSKQF